MRSIPGGQPRPAPGRGPGSSASRIRPTSRRAGRRPGLGPRPQRPPPPARAAMGEATDVPGRRTPGSAFGAGARPTSARSGLEDSWPPNTRYAWRPPGARPADHRALAPGLRPRAPRPAPGPHSAGFDVAVRRPTSPSKVEACSPGFRGRRGPGLPSCSAEEGLRRRVPKAVNDQARRRGEDRRLRAPRPASKSVFPGLPRSRAAEAVRKALFDELGERPSAAKARPETAGRPDRLRAARH